nr:efflux pump aflt [Quercus suber]
MVLAMVVAAIGGGQLTGRIGYYTPLMYASAVLMPIGAGLVTTFTATTNHSAWIGYQVLFGFGLGLGMQQGNVAAQTVLSKRDVPMGVSLIFFSQTLGGAIFVSVGQNVWTSSLVQGLVELVPGLDPQQIVNAGATNLKMIVPQADLAQVLLVYNSALRECFVVATCVACLACLGALAMEWKSVKKGKGQTAAAMKESPPSEVDTKEEEAVEEKV